MQTARLEPITRKSPVHGCNGQDTGVSRPSTHWRGIFAELPALATPVHHLFSLPAAACLSENQTLAKSEETKHCTPPHPDRPVSCPRYLVSCPSSLCSSQRDMSENMSLSYTAFRKSLAATKSSLKLPHAYQKSHVPLGEHACEVVARCGHVQPEDIPTDTKSQCSLANFHKRRTEHEQMMSRWSTIVGVRC